MRTSTNSFRTKWYSWRLSSFKSWQFLLFVLLFHTHQASTTCSLLDFNVTGTITAGQAGQGWSVNGDAYLAWSAEL
jgi:hypothetical protein